MWAKAAKDIKTFSEGVITAIDADGYPLSVRQLSLPYDAASGTMRVIGLENVGAKEGPACLLCHFHDDDFWNMRAIQLKGRLERRDGDWTFVTTAYTAPSMIAMIRGINRSTKAYLAKRNLAKPVVDFAAIKRLWVRADEIRAKRGT